MTLGDIIALAKQGYKPGDIKELIELGNTPTTPTETPADLTPEDTPDQPAEENVSRETSAEDIKAELEKMRAELERTKADLQAAQKENSRKGVEQPDVDASNKNIDDWIRSFM